MKYSNLNNFKNHEEILINSNLMRDVYANFYFGIALATFKTLTKSKEQTIRISYCKDGIPHIIETKLLDVKPFDKIETSAGTLPFLSKNSNTFILKITDKNGQILYDKTDILFENTNLSKDFINILTRVFGTQNPDYYSQFSIEQLYDLYNKQSKQDYQIKMN